VTNSEASAVGGTVLVCVFVVMPIAICVHLVSEYPVISAIVALGLVTFAAGSFLARRKRIAQAASALAFATKNALANAETIVKDHAAELTIRRKQLTVTLNYGLVNASKWEQERNLFIEKVVDPRVGGILTSGERLFAVWQMIDAATAQFASSRVPFSPNMDPIDFEEMVADGLTDLGWQTRLTKGSGDQGIDVIAEMRGKRVVIQCKRYASSIGNSAVQEAHAGKSFENADFAAVVSNAKFTRGARQLAASTNVILLHHDELNQLEPNVFSDEAMVEKASELI
jgi:restriction system protein